MKKYVMFGHGHLFSDFVDVIHGNGGILHKVVQNQAEVVSPGKKTLEQRLDEIVDPRSGRLRDAASYPVGVQSLDDFVPASGEHYLIGLTGFQMAALQRSVEGRAGLKCAPLVHPSASISPSVQLADGVVVHAGAIVASGVCLGPHVVVNKGAIIGHDTVVDEHAVIQLGARVGGFVRVGYGAYIAMGSVVLPELDLGAYSVVAAGATVLESVPEHTLVAGTPARFKKQVHVKEGP